MTAKFKTAMLAAAQLTSAGSLTAATAAIQRALAGEFTAPAPHAAAGAGLRAAGEGVVIDVEARWADARTERPPASSRQSAPGPQTAAGQTLAGTYSAPAGSREYLLHLPPRAASGDRLPLVVMLHGCTQSPQDFAAGTGMNRLADEHGFIVLYPGQSRAANQNGCWNWFNPRDQRAGAGEPLIIAGMVREMVARHPADAGRVHVAGLSAGGAMAALLAEAYPDLFATVAVHSGLPAGAAHDLPSALNAMKRGASGAVSNRSRGKPVRTMVIHGRQDRTVHPANGQQLVDAALAAWPDGGLTTTQETRRSPGGRSYTRTLHADAAGTAMVEQWEVQGAGHAWSGGSPGGSYTDPIGPDASAAIAGFFGVR